MPLAMLMDYLVFRITAVAVNMLLQNNIINVVN